MFKLNHPNYFFTSDNIRIFYNTNFKPSEYDPSKPTIILIYGLLCSNEHFRYQIPFLEEAGFQILIHDYRFHFASTQVGNIETVNFKNIAKDLHELMVELKIPRAVFLGHSMGVNICLEHAKIYPGDVSAMILISGTVVPPQDVMFDSNVVDIVSPHLQKLTKKYPKIHSTIWSTSYLNPLAQLIVFDGGFNKKKVEIEFVQMYMKKISELPKELFFHLLKEMQNHDVIGYLEQIKAPTLVIGGDKDKIIPNYLQKILTKKLPNSEIYIVKDGSHVPQVDFPEMINQRIQQFIFKKIYN
jgi:non-heme chloroperoxidase